MTEDKHSVHVNIFGHEYSIRGEANEDYIRELARYVDGKMAEVARTTGVSIPLRAAILASINLADEVFRLRRTRGEKSPAPDSQQTVIAPEAITALATHIEDVLKEGS